MMSRNSLTSRIIAAAENLAPDLVELRRSIHAEPEVGLHLPATQRRILKALSGLDLEITQGRELSSVTAVLRGGLPGPTVLLRADMDALPITETAEVPYRSTNGAMHACGHDLHVAGLVGAAHLLAEHRSDLAGAVILMFQPGEEGHGGARLMIDEGVLEAAGTRPVAAYAIHVGNAPRGIFLTRPGTVTASSTHLTIDLRGRGGHGSRPHETLDPVPVAAEMVLALQTYSARRFDSFDPVVISVTNLTAGSGADNIIPESVQLTGTVRTVDPNTLSSIEQGLPQLVQGIAAAHGLEATVALDTGYPSVVNDGGNTRRAMETLRNGFGPRVVEVPRPTMGAEDFSFISQQIPTTMVLLGAAPTEDAAPNHSPGAAFDDSVLGDQAAALALLAIDALGSEQP
ncbi:M20 metallopeptidase family protein [Nocardioides albus]|uniref:Hippurate hydrolase n=1 Tax=Nocardioides albus TaxID=1841 RepID=A0A7W5A7N1_9ACTN|nr:M20 family metallopeptidase [Nocardioides albus]MBB3091198.1 hippurate hydrolase [Nocardioides albus]GGU33656.1 amidohydrolase [Nocardioides albus]